jgi:hypothetical protein
MDKVQIGHSIKRIAEALKERNSIFSCAVNRGLVNPIADDIVTYLNADYKMVKLMDDLHNQLMEEEK